jgi:hypothetical protein
LKRKFLEKGLPFNIRRSTVTENTIVTVIKVGPSDERGPRKPSLGIQARRQVGINASWIISVKNWRPDQIRYEIVWCEAQEEARRDFLGRGIAKARKSVSSGSNGGTGSHIPDEVLPHWLIATCTESRKAIG